MLGRRDWFALAGFVAAVGAALLVGSLSAMDAALRYAEFDKPGWAPPPWVFGPVWTVLYAAIAWSGWRVWRVTGSAWSVPLRVYWAQLFLNAFWTPLFFAADLQGVALAWILALDAAVAACIVLFRRVDAVAAWMLAPYLAWTLFATALNAAIWWLNR